MKTPKRHFELTTGLHVPTETMWDRPQEEVSSQRWKRKNKIKQLKRSLHRYKHGTNLPFYCNELHAYILLQELKKPGKKATCNDWNGYILSLRQIASHIESAITQAAISCGRCLEREYGKEEKK